MYFYCKRFYLYSWSYFIFILYLLCIANSMMSLITSTFVWHRRQGVCTYCVPFTIPLRHWLTTTVWFDLSAEAHFLKIFITKCSSELSRRSNCESHMNKNFLYNGLEVLFKRFPTPTRSGLEPKILPNFNLLSLFLKSHYLNYGTWKELESPENLDRMELGRNLKVLPVKKYKTLKKMWEGTNNHI